MKVTDFISKYLAEKRIKYVFELAGGMITHLLDSLTTYIQIITMHHEQSAAFAADAYGRASGLPGIALATSGPGATNLLTGIASCYFDSVPAIFITGQVNRHELKGERLIRQLGFQETDIVNMATPITKATFLVSDPNTIPDIFEKAFQISTMGRPGPVLIDIPMDVQRSQIEIEITKQIENKLAISKSIDLLVLSELVDNITKAQRPIILAGRGVNSAFATNSLKFLAERLRIPIVTTLLAIDVIEFNHPLRIGFIGSYGNRWANIALGESDLIIVLGSRLDIRQTGADTKFFEKKRKVYHVDCDKCEINNRIKGCVPIVSDLNFFFFFFIKYTDFLVFTEKKEWYKYINELKERWPDSIELDVVENSINPNIFMHQLSNSSKRAKVYLSDVGAHQMWAAQSLEIQIHQKFYTSAGMGAMGFALPASIGASFAFDKEPVVVIIGDGCMQLNIQELQTIVRNKLPVKIIVMNNQCLGMIRQFQDSYFESRYQSTHWGYSAPNFEKVALAYGIISKTISTPQEVKEAVDWLWCDDNKNEPVLLQVMIDSNTNVYPKIAYGKPITEMEPFAKPLDMEGT
ncbi:MAG: thiamine pyrophosphate-binding protein [Bacteroidetes bacterium]|nr:thiamine pyrophosphate-binding protein [Bacteroidota bacterium]